MISHRRRESRFKRVARTTVEGALIFAIGFGVVSGAAYFAGKKKLSQSEIVYNRIMNEKTPGVDIKNCIRC